jgi:hypothetical protein
MMKTNVMTVDASLLLVMKNSTFAFLTDCLLLLSYPLIFMQQFSKTGLLPHHLDVWQDTLGSTKISSETGQTGEDTGQTDALRTSHFKIMLPPSQTCLLFSYIFCGMLLIGDNLISRTSR